MENRVFWTQEALQNFIDITIYLETEWTATEVVQFHQHIFKTIEVIIQFPYIFPSTKRSKKLRKAVVSKHTSLIYSIEGNEVYIVYIINNKANL